MPLSQLDPYWQTRDEATVRLYHGDALEVLERLPSQSVHCAVTSPPYWGLRDYGTGTWEGGDSNCLHKPDEEWYQSQFLESHGFTGGQINVKAAATRRWYRPDGSCRCGATRTDQQIGAESHPDLYVSRLVEVFRELRRVLRDDGTFWLDIGDTYSGGGTGRRDLSKRKGSFGNGQTSDVGEGGKYSTLTYSQRPPVDVPSGNLLGIPWRVAFALQADGWILRQDIIHSKPAPMTESVTNRCTKSHNYVFMFAKKAGYFFDQFAIREKSLQPLGMSATAGKQHKQEALGRNLSTSTLGTNYGPDTRNKRSVWTVSNSGYKGAHFAVFPPALILPCIKAGTSEKGCCTECGAPWKRVVERVRQPTRPGENSKTFHGGTKGAPPGKRQHFDLRERLNGEVTGNRDPERHVTSLRHLGWYPSCKCYGLQEIPPTPSADDSGYAEWVRQARELCRQAEEEHGDSVESCVVLDPFIGSGTTAVVCLGLGRYSMGIDLSEEYLKKNAIPRIEGELLGRPALASLVPR